MLKLIFDTYGKTRVRLLQLLREAERHRVVEIAVNVLLEGDFAECYTEGDNSRVLPTDTMKNTVYAIARLHPIESVETYGLDLARHFLESLPHVATVRLEVEQTRWDRVSDHAATFEPNRKEKRFTELNMTREAEEILSGFRNLQILKTSQSAFAGFLKDQYTTLPETRDRLLGTILDADWVASGTRSSTEFDRLFAGVKTALLDAFAIHDSLSVQHTLYAMGEAVLAQFEVIQQIHLVMPNKHCLLVDLSRFGLDNPNMIFVPTDEPSGYIEARLSR